MIATIAGPVAGKFKFGLMPVSGALGRAGDGGEQDRAEHKANDAAHGKDKSLPFGQALAFGCIDARKKRPRLIGKREIDQHDPRRGWFSAAAYFDAAQVNLLGLGYQGQGNAEPAPFRPASRTDRPAPIEGEPAIAAPLS
jgi:hypothetical protein